MRTEYPQVQALRLSVRELEADVRERTVLVNPTVSYTREDAGLTSDDFLLVTQDLPLWGRRRLRGEAARDLVAAAEADVDAELLEVETDVRLTFTDLLVAQEQARALEAGVAALGALVTVLQTRETEGEGSRFDRLRVEREVADVETDLATVQIGRRVAQSRLTAFFAAGADPEGVVAAGSLDERPVLPDTSPSPTRLAERRSDYRALTLEAASWESERSAARRLRLPAASLTGGVKRAATLGSSDTGYAVTAAVSLPLFNRGEAQVARAEAGRARAEAERHALAARIAADVGAAAAIATRYRAVADRYRADSVERAAELVMIATAAYEEGEYGILELLDAHRGTLRARLRLVDLSAAARRAAIELDHALGERLMP
jgi:cobalt-zinc-cadmium efflux system outer membrane protein